MKLLKWIRFLVNYTIWYLSSPQRAKDALILFYRQLYAWITNQQAMSFYPHHFNSVDTLKTRRTSDTVFVFGAGASLMDISDDEWAHVAKHNTIGWHLFGHQDFVRGDILIFRETHYQTINERKTEIRQYVADVNANPQLEQALWICQAGWFAVASNLLIGMRLLSKDTTILRYKNSRRGESQLPIEHFQDGVTHGAGTLTDAVNLAYQGGWKRIVLIGIDLYDTEYFKDAAWDTDPEWVANNQDRSVTHPTIFSGIIDQMALWVPWLQKRGIEIYVQNPRSLMADLMPVYDWKQFEE